MHRDQRQGHGEEQDGAERVEGAKVRGQAGTGQHVDEAGDAEPERESGVPDVRVDAAQGPAHAARLRRTS